MVRDRTIYGGVVALIGAVAGSVPVLDGVADVLAGNTPGPAVVENAPLALLSAGIVAVGVRLAASDWDGEYVRTVARISVLNAAGVASVVGLILFVQVYVQTDVKPFVIAANAVVIGVLGGVLIGVRTAQQRRATDAAAAERDRIRALFGNLPHPIAGVETVEGEPRVRGVNRAFAEVFGVDRDGVAGAGLADLIVPEDESFDPAPSDAPRVSAGRDAFDAWDENLVELETVDGRREFVRLIAPVEADPDRDRYAIYVDVTGERQRRERLLVLGRTLRHDIRNRINVVALGCERIAEETDGEVDEPLERIETAAADLLRTSERTYDVEKRIAGDTDPVPRDLVPIVRGATESVAGDRDCAVDVETPAAAYAGVTDAFRTAVEEVVDNAVEHHDGTPTVEVSVAASPDGEYYDVRVADDGPGIPPEQVEIFTRETDPTQTHHGEGLGLWTVRWVMQNSGGELSFAPNAPRGTVVTLRVPRAPPPGIERVDEDDPRRR